METTGRPNMMDITDLKQFADFRVMPTRVLKVSYLDDFPDQPIVSMEYCQPEDATCWAVEGILPEGEWPEQGVPEVEFLCETQDQGLAYVVADFFRLAIAVEVD